MKIKKIGVFCGALVAILAVSAIIAGARQFVDPAYAVLTPCGDVDTSGVLGGGSSASSGSASQYEGGLAENQLDVTVVASDMVAIGATEFTISSPTVQLDINYRALTCIQIYDNGVLVASIKVTPSMDWSNIQPIFDLLTVGSHTITVIGFDLQGRQLDHQLVFNIIYSPEYGVPDTGVIRIGGMSIARMDLITIVSSVIVAVGVFVLLVVMKKRKEERNIRR